MAGHSKWKNIQHRKGAQDAKRGKIFTKAIKEITVSVKTGGADPDSNPRLRAAITSAKAVNMPKDNIDRAIKKADGTDGNEITEVFYEGYGPGGVAIFIECATDNATRTVANIRSYFNKNGGSLGKDGCLQFVFDRKGIFTLEAKGIEEEEFTLELIDAGASDVMFEGDIVTVTSEMEDFGAIQKKIEDLKLDLVDSGLQRIPLDSKALGVEEFAKVNKLLDKIEEDDDVQKVYHNIEFTSEIEEYLTNS